MLPGPCILVGEWTGTQRKTTAVASYCAKQSDERRPAVLPVDSRTVDCAMLVNKQGTWPKAVRQLQLPRRGGGGAVKTAALRRCSPKASARLKLSNGLQVVAG